MRLIIARRRGGTFTVDTMNLARLVCKILGHNWVLARIIGLVDGREYCVRCNRIKRYIQREYDEDGRFIEEDP